jgi:hypothetical protein
VGVSDLFKEHYWKLTTRGGTFSGSNVGLSNLGTENFPGALVALELGTDQNLTNLGGITLNHVVKSTAKSTALGNLYVLGKSDKVDVTVINVITPTPDDIRNNVLQISNIELFPDNKVTLVDRYGVPVKTWTGFKNFETTSTSQDGFDFATMGIGNYICIVEYTDSAGGKQKITQMVTVLK